MTGKEYQEYRTGELNFVIEKGGGPGPFQIVMGLGDMFRDRDNRDRMVLEFTLLPVEAGERLLGHRRKFHILFEVALLGPSTTMVHVGEPLNLRLIGRFYANFFSREKDLNEWEWEIIFNTQSREGLVFRLDTPMPMGWRARR